jgi:DNA-binding MarR family transcriptional regulator
LVPDPEGPPAVAPDLRTLGDYLLQDPLRSSVRVLILISLGMNRRLSFTDLLELTGSSKGSLSHHLDQLSAAGLLRSRMVFTLAGPRIQVEITPQGLSVYDRLCRTLSELAPANPPRTSSEGPAAGLSR